MTVLFIFGKGGDKWGYSETLRRYRGYNSR